MAGRICIQVFFFRAGRNNGNRAYFPHATTKRKTIPEVPRRVSRTVLREQAGAARHPAQPPARRDRSDCRSAERAHGTQGAESRSPSAGPSASWSTMPRTNARDALERRMAESATNRDLLAQVGELFGLDARTRSGSRSMTTSHVQGAHATGAMIVAGPDGFIKPAYRRFNMRGAATEEKDRLQPRRRLCDDGGGPHTALLARAEGRPGAQQGTMAGPDSDRWRQRASSHPRSMPCPNWESTMSRPLSA